MIPVAPTQTFAPQVADFKQDGYCVFPGLLGAETVEGLNLLREQAVRDWRFASAAADFPDAVGAMLERAPRDILPLVSHPILLGFGEAIMGPVVQLDSAVLAGDPSDETVMTNAPVMWHRDRFGSIPPTVYVKPASVVFISYLQDMSQEMGQLRVLPASHRRPDRVPDSGLHSPVTGERLLGIGAGDVVALHHNVLHSGGRNTSGQERRFLGFIYSVSMLRQEDNFDGPNCCLMREAACVRRRYATLSASS